MLSICIRILIVFFIVLAGPVWSQDDNSDAIRTDAVLSPEAYKFKFSSAGSVDNHGDYSVNLPLLTVPGRGGLDYPISINYKSGITMTQRATWVGLGWNLNPGSITRVINGIPDNIKGLPLQSNGNNWVTENGAIEHYPALADAQGVQYRFPDSTNRDFHDYFLVSIPGIVSGLLVPVSADNDTSVINDGYLYVNGVDYSFQNWNGWTVKYRRDQFTRENLSAFGSTINTYWDIKEFWLTDPNGTSYVFSLPLKSEMIHYGGFNQNDPRFIIEYVSTWQLTVIFTSECSYNLFPVTPIETAGNWIKFEYCYPYNGTRPTYRNIRPLNIDRSGSNTIVDPFGLLNQTTYLSKIRTPTHEAVFGVTPRNDISFLNPQDKPDSTATGGDWRFSNHKSLVRFLY